MNQGETSEIRRFLSEDVDELCEEITLIKLEDLLERTITPITETQFLRSHFGAVIKDGLVESLSLSSSSLETIPDELFDLTQLKRLDLSETKIEAIPNLFGRFSQLKELNVYNLKPHNFQRFTEELENLNILWVYQSIQHINSTEKEKIPQKNSKQPRCQQEDLLSFSNEKIFERLSTQSEKNTQKPIFCTHPIKKIQTFKLKLTRKTPHKLGFNVKKLLLTCEECGKELEPKKPYPGVATIRGFEKALYEEIKDSISKIGFCRKCKGYYTGKMCPKDQNKLFFPPKIQIHKMGYSLRTEKILEYRDEKVEKKK